jgi:hypothetical protein
MGAGQFGLEQEGTILLKEIGVMLLAMPVMPWQMLKKRVKPLIELRGWPTLEAVSEEQWARAGCFHVA